MTASQQAFAIRQSAMEWANAADTDPMEIMRLAQSLLETAQKRISSELLDHRANAQLAAMEAQA